MIDEAGYPHMSPRSAYANSHLADLFAELAGYLSLESGAPYRRLAYERAAQVFQNHPVSIAALARQGSLRELPGVGANIEAKVLELLDTGRITILEELRDRYPAGLLDIMRLPGIGPRKAKALWSSLGIYDLAGLRDACVENRVRGLRGMGAKTEESILREVERADHADRADRLLLGHVDPSARRLLLALRSFPGTRQADVAGSLRRRKATVKDIDLVAASAAPEETMAAFAALPELAEVGLHGIAALTGRTQGGVSVDLRIATPQAYGNLLLHFTGSAQHNVDLRGLAKEQGFHLSEHGLEGQAASRTVTHEREADVYAALGLSYIPPELREGQGEIEAAAEDRLPALVERGHLRGDLHVHSTWSDGRATIEEMAQAAAAVGLEYIAICDHSRSLGVARGLTSDRIEDQVREIRKIDAQVPHLSVLAGCEVDILADGSLDLPDDILGSLDFVVASIHSGLGQDRTRIMRRLLGAMENPRVAAIGHPTGRLLGRRAPYEINLEALADAAVRTGTFLEINASYERLDLAAPMAREARDRGARFIISSDAHDAAGFALLDYGVDEARRGWIEARDVMNTLPLEELLPLLPSHRYRNRGSGRPVG